jgi:hypothetical protein
MIILTPLGKNWRMVAARHRLGCTGVVVSLRKALRAP